MIMKYIFHIKIKCISSVLTEYEIYFLQLDRVFPEYETFFSENAECKLYFSAFIEY